MNNDVSYIQPWGEQAGFVQNDIEGWLGPVTFALSGINLQVATATPSPLILDDFSEYPELGETQATLLQLVRFDYTIVETSQELTQAILTGLGTSAPSPYRIFLQPGTYELNRSFTIDRHIKIYGMGSSITQINVVPAPPGQNNNNLANNSLFYVSGFLELYDLTIAGGGNCTLNRVVIEDSNGIDSVPTGGGAIQIAGSAGVSIRNSILRNNEAGGGGAIQIDDGGGGRIINISCTYFEDNQAGYGGALLYAGGDPPTIEFSAFDNNMGLQGGGAIFNLQTQTGGETVDAGNNYWPNGTPNIDVGATTGIDSITPGVNVTPLLTTLPDNRDECNITVDLETDPPHPAEILERYYSVRITNAPGAVDEVYWENFDANDDLDGWNTNQSQEILDGVLSTALAFAIQADLAPIEAFRTVMERPAIDDNDPVLIQISHSGTSACLVSFPDEYANTLINCGTAAGTSEYVYVHELGHVFENRSNQNDVQTTSLTEHVQETDASMVGEENVMPIRDSDLDQNGLGRIVMGNTANGWQRGTRGWGSGPASIYNNASPPVAISKVFTDFQQNTPPYQLTGPNAVNPYEETAADMLLNWVYELIDPTNLGFSNRSWSPTQRNANDQLCSELVDGCADLSNPGDARFNWMNQVMSDIFDERDW